MEGRVDGDFDLYKSGDIKGLVGTIPLMEPADIQARSVVFVSEVLMLNLIQVLHSIVFFHSTRTASIRRLEATSPGA
jgi:hypothetical protein